MKLEQTLTPYTKTKWMKDLNAGVDTIKLQEKNVGRILFDINCSNIFFNPSPKAKATKAKISKFGT